MGLEIAVNTCRDRKTGEQFGAAWQVRLTRRIKEKVILHGFARRHDAEIAVKVCLETGIDWAAEPAELQKQLREKFGGRRELEKHVAERLQW